MTQQWTPKLFNLQPTTVVTGAGPMRYYVPYTAHIPGPGGCTDGFGGAATGNAEPKFDTLFGIFNPSTTTSMNVTVRTFNADGSIKPWQNSQTKAITLPPQQSVAFTFIVGNIYTDVPQNFTGYSIVDLSLPAGINCMLGGGGCYPAYWNTYSMRVPVFADSAQLAGVRVASARSTFTVPYTIPYYDDLNHHTNLSYRTVLTLTNFDTLPCYAFLTYTVATGYPKAGFVYTYTTAQIAGGQSLPLDLATALTGSGFPSDTTASEGSLQIVLRNTSSGSDPLVNRLLIPYIQVQNAVAGQGGTALEQFSADVDFY